MTQGGARETTHYCSRTFENSVWHTHGVYEACRAPPDLRPDLIVGQSGFGSTLFLSELYPGVPVVSYFEYDYHPHQSDMDFRPEFPPAELDFLRARARNAMILLDLENCRRGYCPTHFQRDLFPGPTARRPTSSSTGSRRRSSIAGRMSPAGSGTGRSPRPPGS